MSGMEGVRPGADAPRRGAQPLGAGCARPRLLVLGKAGTIECVHDVTKIDLATLQVVKTISVPAQPQEVLIRPDGYVGAMVSSGEIAALDRYLDGVGIVA